MSPEKSLGAECCHFFRILSTELNAGVVTELREASLTAGEIAKRLKRGKEEVAKALEKLHACNFVRPKGAGRKQLWAINTDTVLPLLALVEKHVRLYCGNCIKLEQTIKKEAARKAAGSIC